MNAKSDAVSLAEALAAAFKPILDGQERILQTNAEIAEALTRLHNRGESEAAAIEINNRRRLKGQPPLDISRDPFTERRARCEDRESGSKFTAIFIARRSSDERLHVPHVVRIEEPIFSPTVLAEIDEELNQQFASDEAARIDGHAAALIQHEKRRLRDHAIWSRAWQPLLLRYVSRLPDKLVTEDALTRLAIWSWIEEATAEATT